MLGFVFGIRVTCKFRTLDFAISSCCRCSSDSKCDGMMAFCVEANDLCRKARNRSHNSSLQYSFVFVVFVERSGLL